MNIEDPTSKTTVCIIAAMSENRVIGVDGGLPWRLPDEMKHFMRLTSGHTVVMGRKTFESIGRKPLPNRRNIIVTHDPDYAGDGFEAATSIRAAIDLASAPTPNPESPAPELFICGGQRVYEEALPLADRMVLTTVHTEVDGDTHFPAFDETAWQLADQTRHEADKKHAHAFTVQRYQRRP